jgi:hypothetical protein
VWGDLAEHKPAIGPCDSSSEVARYATIVLPESRGKLPSGLGHDRFAVGRTANPCQSIPNERNAAFRRRPYYGCPTLTMRNRSS